MEIAPGWRSLLQGRSPKEILSRIVSGDPLRLRARAGRGLEAQALLLDADRVFLRALALTSRAAVRYRGQPEIEEWLGARVDDALREILEEGEEAPRPEGTGISRGPDAFETMAAPLGLDPRTLARACARFHRLPFPDRRAFFDLVLHARSLDELARASGESATEIARRARRGLEALLAADDGGGNMP
jgi:DNA-directed RNA polymerase specialized sigma24 family protein